MQTYELRLHNEPFQCVKSGTKTIEMRLLDEKRKLFKVGDKLIFKNRLNENEIIETEIIALHKYNSFEELYKHFNKISLGYKENEPAHFTDMEFYYPKEEQQKYGVVGIEIKLI